MLVVYRGRSTEGRFVRITAEYEEYAPWGTPVEIPDAVAASLLTQPGWSTPKADKAAPKE